MENNEVLKKSTKLYLDHENFPMLNKLDEKYVSEMCYDIFKRGYESYFPNIENMNIQNTNNTIYTDSIKSDLNKVSNILEELVGVTNNSSKKGKLTENIVYNMLKTKFKDYTLEETRGIPHSGDAILSFNKTDKILIEVKNYTKAVDRDEVDKLIYDMKYTKIRFSLFISIRSGFVGKKQMSIQEFSYENESYVIVFLPNLFSQIDKVEAGVLLLQKLMQLTNNKNKQNNKNNKKIKWLESSIMGHLTDLDNIYTDLANFKQKYYTLENSIKKSLHEFYFALRSYEVDVKNRVNKVFETISVDLNSKYNKNSKNNKLVKLGVNIDSKYSKNIGLIFEIIMKCGYKLKWVNYKDNTQNKLIQTWYIFDNNNHDVMEGIMLKDNKIVQIVLKNRSFDIKITGNIKLELVRMESFFNCLVT
jgi:hypothetical protein